MRIYRPRIAAFVWLLGLLALGIAGSRVLTSDWLETGFLSLLPDTEQQPEIAQAVRRHNELINGKVICLTGADSAPQAIAYADQLKERLEQSGLFKNIQLQVDQQDFAKRYQQLFAYRYQLLDAQTRSMLLAQPEALIGRNLEMLYSPLGQLQASNLERDPLLLFSRYFNAQNPGRFTLEQGVVIVQDGGRFWALLIADMADNKLHLDNLDILRELMNGAQSQIEATGGELLATGIPLFTAEGSHSAQREIAIVSIGSTLGILLLLLTFRSARPLLLSCLGIAASTFAALVVSIVVFGKIHILTLVFGASLIGVGIDYALHYFCNSFSSADWTPAKGLQYILLGITLDLATSLISYASLGVPPFPLLQEIAFFSVIGLISTWATVVLLFPLLLTGFRPAHKPAVLRLTNYWQQHWPAWLLSNRAWLAPVAVAAVAGGLWQLTPRDDVRLLQSASAKRLAADQKIRQLLPVRADSQFFLVSGKDSQDWHRNEQALLTRLEPLKQQGAIESYDGLSRYWPDPGTQRDNYHLLKRTFYETGLLKRYMAELGFDEQAIAAEQQRFRAAENSSIELAEWLDGADEARKMHWLGCDAGHCVSTVSLNGINNLAALSQLNGLQGVRWVDQATQLSSLFERYRASASVLLAAAYGIVLIGLGLKFGWRNALMIISVPVFATAVSLAMLGWFDQLFSLFNLFALLLVLGIGVDYGIFFFLAEDKRSSTSLAVTLSAITTLLSFGLLAISSTAIVHAFGFTVAAGILTALLLAPLVGKHTR
ncbi:MMPL family transporter [Methylobacter sp. YRD-M1]|uniref:MMPL family transporter n=1 Tax=Methylobacter sp. YRD-M1 TaxID=2911520 RepID=UPI00227A1B4B|nr:MMPL family transporter [Methylobacter sp. YRD-M1]WAK02119.1 transporter [Methylobacter sp. YRD-M1]